MRKENSLLLKTFISVLPINQLKFCSSQLLPLLLLTVLFTAASGQNPADSGAAARGAVHGKILDAFGAPIAGAHIALEDAGSSAVSSTSVHYDSLTNTSGEFAFDRVVVGNYRIIVAAKGFATAENQLIEVLPGKNMFLETVILTVAAINETVTINHNTRLDPDPDHNQNGLILKENDLKALPDDPDDLAAALQALAGPSAGPEGGEVFIDGFSGARVPARNSIREIRLNQNPFSAEFDRLGLGRIEVLTKPGTDHWTGEITLGYENEAFNSRNPFARNRAPFRQLNYDGTISGPLTAKRLSFFVNFERERSRYNTIINAIVLDPNLNPVRLERAEVVPTVIQNFGARADWALNTQQTVALRADLSKFNTDYGNLGGFDLASRAASSRNNENSFRVTHAWAISPVLLNEFRFQFLRRSARQEAADNSPTIQVLDSFTGGGANIGSSFNRETRFEITEIVSLQRGRHSFRIGGRLRRIKLIDSSANNFAGTFIFTSLDQYRNTLLGLPGAAPAQFTIAGGNELSSLTQWDAGMFVQDNWRLNPKITLTFGLRYENQTNIHSSLNLAPRLGLAFAPGGGGKSKPRTVYRAGYGLFYTRFGENLSLQAQRFNGINQQQFVVTDPVLLALPNFTVSGVAQVPTVAELNDFAQPTAVRLVAPVLQAPVTRQGVASVERQLPFNSTVSLTLVNSQTRRLLRSRNLRAFLSLGAVNTEANVSPAVVHSRSGEQFQYESTARFNQTQLIINARINLSEKWSFFSVYTFAHAKSDSDGAGTFPASSFDLENEYGSSVLDIRHRFTIGGNIAAPFGVAVSPFITARSGVPFNITTGVDLNNDSLFTERPALVSEVSSRPGIIRTGFGAFDLFPVPGDQIVERNFGRGPQFFICNLRLGKEFGLGTVKKQQPAASSSSRASATGQKKSNNAEDAPLQLELAVQIRNLFNRTNKAIPVGNLNSALFGQSTALASGFGFGGGRNTGSNRELKFEIRLSF